MTSNSSNSNNLKIRYAQKNDVSSIESCQAASFSFPFRSDDIRDFLDNPLFRVRVLTLDGIIVGHYVVYLRERTVELLSIAIDEAHRGKGYGKKLLDDVFALTKENDSDYVMLDVRQSNTRAINLYTQAGFETLAKRKDFYQQPREDGFTMMACLNGQSIT